MSGHSKWSKIKRQKGVEDQKRGAVFSKLSVAIGVAVKKGGSGDPYKNAALRMLLDKAKQANMPKANIDRAIEKALGAGQGGGMEQVTFEGYGPSGVAVMLVATTDNRQRSAAEVKNLFEKAGGSLGAPGSAAFMFEQRSGSLTAKSYIDLVGDDANKVRKFIERLEGYDDTDRIVHNAKFTPAKSSKSI